MRSNLENGPKPRTVYPPDLDLQGLAPHLGYIFNAEYGPLCANTPINFVGALLYAKYRNFFLDEMLNKGFEIVPELFYPYSLTEGIAVKETRPHLKTGTVLIKNVCGSSCNVGVVTTGKLAGLILSDMTEYGAAYISRFFNDEAIPVPQQYRPYNPWTIFDIDDLNQNRIGLELQEEFKTKYYQYAATVAKKLPANSVLHTSDLFFALCEEQDIPLDRDSFHYTR